MYVCSTRSTSLLARLLWTLACWGSGWCQRDGTAVPPLLSETDVLLLADDEVPKCFTRTQSDFTCFWEEEASNKTFDFLYGTDDGTYSCDVRQQRTDEGTFLHVCFFPESDVYLYTETRVTVVDPGTNTTVYDRSVNVEDQGLLDPPRDVVLHYTGQVGQLQVTWHKPSNSVHWRNGVRYEIRYSSHSPTETERTQSVVRAESLLHQLASLAPGEVVGVQIRARPQGYYTETETGHWSDWSASVDAMVPQSAGDITLSCHTSDLHNVTCQWSERASREHTYSLFYKIDSRGGAEVWRECLQDVNASSWCRFQGNESSVIHVRLDAGPGLLSPTFYTKPFRLNSSVMTVPPGRVRGDSDGGRLDLRWDAPLLALSLHLMYQVQYQPRFEATWKLVTLQGPETRTSLDVMRGSWYRVQVRARPNGSVYAGHWSDWSHCLNVNVSSDIGAFLVPCVLIVMLILSVVFISIFSRYFSKLKQYLWPPIPNLDKVLQGFLTEINGKTWDPPYNVKQCFQESPDSVVEVLSEAPGETKPPGETSILLSPERASSDGQAEQQVEEPGPGTDPEVTNLDYVTLNTGIVAPCLQGNEYVYKEAESAGLGVEEEVIQIQCHCPSFSSSSSLSSSSSSSSSSPVVMDAILNLSYLLRESTEKQEHQGARAPGNLYANLDKDTPLSTN